MVHPEQASRTHSASLEVVRTNQMYDHEASVAAQRPATQSAFLSMDYPVGVPRDQRDDQTPDDPPLSYREYRYKYSQPPRSQSVRSGDSDASRNGYEDSANRNQSRRSPSIVRNHTSSRTGAESSPNTSLAPERSRRTYRSAEIVPEIISWDENAGGLSREISKRRQVSQGAYWNFDVAPSSIARDHAPQTMYRTMPMFSGVREDHGDRGSSKQRASRKDRDQASIPPRAPKIPRLPTPDLDEVDYSKDDMTSRQFCACCKNDDDSEAGSLRRECTVAKMERQCASLHFTAISFAASVHI
ncbi:hypothetical protein GGS26DRAFT_598667 [Hypomontagnella submonticulosa]|nr:hypothetical protein GGS26DRAFT_598667 [Hypomontagnella submonticulosa]